MKRQKLFSQYRCCILHYLFYINRVSTPQQALSHLLSEYINHARNSQWGLRWFLPHLHNVKLCKYLISQLDVSDFNLIEWVESALEQEKLDSELIVLFQVFFYYYDSWYSSEIDLVLYHHLNRFIIDVERQSIQESTCCIFEKLLTGLNSHNKAICFYAIKQLSQLKIPEEKQQKIAELLVNKINTETDLSVVNGNFARYPINVAASKCLVGMNLSDNLLEKICDSLIDQVDLNHRISPCVGQTLLNLKISQKKWNAIVGNLTRKVSSPYIDTQINSWILLRNIGLSQEKLTVIMNFRIYEIYHNCQLVPEAASFRLSILEFAINFPIKKIIDEPTFIQTPYSLFNRSINLDPIGGNSSFYDIQNRLMYFFEKDHRAGLMYQQISEEIICFCVSSPLLDCLVILAKLEFMSHSCDELARVFITGCICRLREIQQAHMAPVYQVSSDWQPEISAMSP